MRTKIALGAGAVGLLAALVWTAWSLGAGRGASPPAVAEVTTLARIPDLTGAIVSQDERLLVYTVRREGATSLIARQLATGEEVVVVPPRSSLELLAVAPDNGYMYFSTFGGGRRRVAAPRVHGGRLASGADGERPATERVAGQQAIRRGRAGSAGNGRLAHVARHRQRGWNGGADGGGAGLGLDVGAGVVAGTRSTSWSRFCSPRVECG
jgi:hypothetical protein